MAALVWQSVYRSFGKAEVLRGFDLAVADGEIVAVLGASGCGKTTALRIAAGLDSADDGQVLIGNDDATGWLPKQRGVGMVFQHDGLLPHLDVAENIGLSLRARRVDRAEIDARVAAVAKLVGCHHLLDRRTQRLSGGERQRVALGRALVRRPEALLLDEPLSSLDLEARVDLRSVVVEAVRSLGTTAVFVTHDHAEASEVGDRVAVMGGGAIGQIDTPEDLYWRPVSLTIALLAGVRSLNVLPVEVCESGWCYGPFSLAHDAWPPWARRSTPSTEHRPVVHLGIRPEHVQLVAPSAGTVDGTVSQVLHLGPDQVVTVDHSLGRMTVRTSSARRSAVGDRLAMSVNPRFLYGFDEHGVCVGTPDRPG